LRPRAASAKWLFSQSHAPLYIFLKNSGAGIQGYWENGVPKKKNKKKKKTKKKNKKKEKKGKKKEKKRKEEKTSVFVFINPSISINQGGQAGTLS
jgi:hypothetical protein